MAAVGGSIKGIEIDGRPFSVTTDADAKVKLGGKKVAVEANGDATVRVLGTVEPWSISDIDIAIDHDKDDAGFLQEKADNMELVPCTITYIDGTTYQGKGIVADDHDFSTAKATSGITLMGEGKLTPQ